LPDVVNLSLVSSADNSFTVTWKRPGGTFDYYVLYILNNNDDSQRNAERNFAGSCTNGTIIHRDKRKLTCERLETSSNVTIEVRTHSVGPPERTSRGVALRDIFIPGETLPDVKILRLVSAGNHAMTVIWDPPQAQFDYYRIGVNAGNKHTEKSSGLHSVGSCENGTIIQPAQTGVTCRYLEACSTVTFTISTYSRGPPELLFRAPRSTIFLFRAK
ncbi:hypothetical protein MTO96_038065, partial [Rhipicephalus appendiculatus]